MNEGAYRNAPPPAREEFAALERRVTQVEKKQPRAPFTLRIWHTVWGGVIALLVTIFAIGRVYDSMKDCGTRVSIFIVLAIAGAVAAITVIASLAQLDPKQMSSPWGKADK